VALAARDRLMKFLDNVTHFTEEERAKIISSYPAHEREGYEGASVIKILRNASAPVSLVTQRAAGSEADRQAVKSRRGKDWSR
jgi:hypothetical protein